MSSQPVPPSIDSVSFSCPHCGAHAAQTWYEIGASEVKGNLPVYRLTLSEFGVWRERTPGMAEEVVATLKAHADSTEKGGVFFSEIFDENSADSSLYCPQRVTNLAISRCYSCERLSVWVADRVVYPRLVTVGEPPNPDLPADVRSDYDEARSILDASPRGAAALLRLCIQKLCKHLGEPGKDINADIGSLVAQGLSVQVANALDIVRVIGNESVHPGQIDLRDDPATAARLFELVNLITEKMISEPKHIAEMYGRLPESKRRAIEDRDKKKP